MSGVIVRDVRYEYAFDGEPPEAIELQDMTVVNDSGAQIFMDVKEKAA